MVAGVAAQHVLRAVRLPGELAASPAMAALAVSVAPARPASMLSVALALPLEAEGAAALGTAPIPYSGELVRLVESW